MYKTIAINIATDIAHSSLGEGSFSKAPSAVSLNFFLLI